MKISIIRDKDSFNRNSSIVTKTVEEIESLPVGTYTEIILDRTLDDFTFEERAKLLNELLPKLRYNGIITIIGHDYYELARQIYLKNINDQKLISSILSSVNSISTITSVEQELLSFGLTITHKGLETLEYSISAQKVHKK